MPGTRIRRLVAALVGATLATFALATSAAAQPDRSTGRPTVVSMTGQALGRPDLRVDVVVAVQPGQSAAAAARGALAAQGARPLHKAELNGGYAATGLVWPTPALTQAYNPAGSPSGIDTPSLLQTSQGYWNGISTSAFRFSMGGVSGSCGSLVRECAGSPRNQVPDAERTVAWLPLKDRYTLAVTWYTTSGTKDADVAMNSRFSWHAGCASDPAGRFSAPTVLAHELGHAAGLNHSSDGGAIMSTPYDSPMCTVGTDDREGISILYPAATSSIDVTVTSTSGAPVTGATVAIDDTGLIGQSTGVAGVYRLSDVPVGLDYTVRAGADGYADATADLTLGSSPANMSLTLTADSGGGGGGGAFCPPGQKAKNRC